MAVDVIREMCKAKRLIGERKLRKCLDATTLWESPKILLIMVSFMNTLGLSRVFSYLFKYQCSFAVQVFCKCD